MTLTSKSGYTGGRLLASDTQRIVEEGPETTRERHFKVKTHQRAHYGGFLFSEVKKLATQEDDSDVEDILQHIDRIDQAESEYNSEKVKQQLAAEGSPQDVKYLDLQTASVDKQFLNPRKLSGIESLNATESDKILIENEH